MRQKKYIVILFYLMAFFSVLGCGSLYAAGENVMLVTDDDGFGDTMFGYLSSLGYNVSPTPDINIAPNFPFTNFQAVVVTRSFANFGGDISFPSSLAIHNYVYNNPNFLGDQGAVFAFTASVKDILNGVDGFGPNTATLFNNALAAAVASGHGYVGELNGAVVALSANTAGLQPISVLTGVATVITATPVQSVAFVNGYGSTSLGTGVSPFYTFEDPSPFSTKTPVLNPLNTFSAVNFLNGDSFLLTNKQAGSIPNPVPEIPAGIVPLVLMALSGLAFRLKGFLRKSV